MTFEHSRTVTTSAPPARSGLSGAIPASWHSWDPAVESVTFEGHFGEGAAGMMVLTGGIEVPVTLEMVEPGARYLDRLTIGDLVIEIDHVVRAHADGRRGHGQHGRHRSRAPRTSARWSPPTRPRPWRRWPRWPRTARSLLNLASTGA